jgi:membrane protease YdiL (CAAX protease family)
VRSQPLPEPIDEHSSSTRAPRRRAPLAFVALLLALSVPFWLVGAAAERQLLPGLPMGALMAICPAVAASILVYREARTAGVARLLKRAFDHERIRDKVWYAPILLLMPAMTAVAYGVMRAAGVPLPAPQFPVLAVPVLFLAFFAAGVGEELGWSGYVTDVLQARWSALRTGVLVGLVWAAWHLVVLLQAHRPPAWIAAWALGTVALRVLTVWLGEERVRRGPLSRHAERQLAALSERRLPLGPALHRPGLRAHGRDRHARVGTAHVDSPAVERAGTQR